MVRLIYALPLWLLISATWGLPAHAQTHFTSCATSSSVTATVILPADTAPSLDGQPLPEGTEIAAVTPEGLCAGIGIWDGNSLGLTLYGRDELPNGTTLPGFEVNDPLRFEVWTDGLEAPLGDEQVAITFTAEATYLQEEGTFVPNGIYKLGMFASTTPPPPVAGDCAVPDITETVDGETITLTITDPEGLQTIAFVDPDSKPALQNLIASSDSDRLVTTDGLWWSVLFDEESDDPVLSTPLTEAALTLTKENPDEPEVAYFVRATNTCGAVLDLDPVHQLEAAPEVVALNPLYPNPAQFEINVDVELPEATDLRVRVYDVLGRPVATLVDGPKTAGRHTITWQPDRRLSAGVYLVRLTAAGSSHTRKVTLVR